MALQIEKVVSSGIVASYWRITSTGFFDCVLGVGMVFIGGYLSQQARITAEENGYAPIEIIPIQVSVPNWNVNIGSLTQIYDYLKTLPEFEGAIDVMDVDS